MAQTPTTLFPSIGSVADQTDNLQETDESTAHAATLPTNDNEEKVVQEVESLCMKCGEQVSYMYFFLLTSDWKFSLGNYAYSPYVYTIFPRSDRDVFPLRSLWIGE